MKEEAIALEQALPDPNQALNRLREYLQAFILRSFHESEAFIAEAPHEASPPDDHPRERGAPPLPAATVQ